jgi:spermidine synthase
LSFFSGAAGLGYQIIWTRSFAVGLGHEMPALLAILAAFMAGMALGAWAISKAPVRNAGQWYGCLELTIGLWAATTPFLVPAAAGLALKWIGIEPSPPRHWLVAFLLPFLVLLPATAAMGATLPMIERFVTPLTWRRQSVAGLYAANTSGAMAGVLLSAFVILPQFGLRAALVGFAAINVCCGLLALLLSRQVPNAFQNPNVAAADPWRLWITLFVTGLLGIGYEVLGVRVLAQVLENTVYTYAAVLAVFLLGLSIGAAAWHHFGSRWRLGGLVCATGAGCALGVFAATQAGELYRSLRAAFGDNMGGVLLAEMIVASAIFLVPTVLMGMTFSHLAHASRGLAGGLGRALAINMMGAAAAPFLFSVVMLPWIGAKWVLTIIVVSYVLLARRLTGWRWAAAATAAALAILPGSQLRFLSVPAGGRPLESREGTMASVAVIEDALANRTLRVDNRFQMGGTGAADAEYRHAHLPLLLHPDPHRALLLGLGTGITFDAVAAHTNVTADGVELLPEIVAMMPWFSPYNDSVRTNSRLRIFVADARRFVQSTTNSYDVIIGDLFHPARDGAGSLYTLEHFRSIRERLAPGGLFCQWLPLHQLGDETLRAITRTFLAVFPDSQAWLLRFNIETPVIGLLGTTRPIGYRPDWMELRAAPRGLSERLQKLALGDSIRLFGNLLAGAPELRALAGRGTLNTDDNAAVLFGAPRFSYLNDERPWDRLLAFPVLNAADTAGTLGFSSQSLDRFMSARSAFIRGLIAEAEGRSEEAHLQFVESARLSEDFTMGYARILTIAMAESRTRPEYSRSLLTRLVEAQPSRPVAAQLLSRLFPERPR